MKGKPIFSMFDEATASAASATATGGSLTGIDTGLETNIASEASSSGGGVTGSTVKEFSEPLTPMNIYTEIMEDDAIPISKTLWLKVWNGFM